MNSLADRTKKKVAIVGLGTVGSGLAEILLSHNDRVARHSGCEVELARVVVRDAGKPRKGDVPNSIVTDDLTDVLEDTEIGIVAQLIGGLEPARTIMLKLLESGKDVVTANKALIAEHGEELFQRARELNRTIAFEASVAGGIPIIANISQCLSGNQITSPARHPERDQQLHRVPNGRDRPWTTRRLSPKLRNLVTPKRIPTMDVDGTDAAQKLAILAHLAFGADVPKVGVDSSRGNRQRRNRRHSMCQGAGLSASSCSPSRNCMVTNSSCMFRRHVGQKGDAAGRSPRKRSTRSVWWATPLGQFSITVREPARCQPPRQSRQT